MNRIRIRPQWSISEEEDAVEQQMPVLLRLLAGIYEHGSLSKACLASGVSYRYAWGLVRNGARLFGVPLVRLTRGQGASLTTLGEKLVWADPPRIAARLAPIFDSLSAELAAEFERVRADAQACPAHSREPRLRGGDPARPPRRARHSGRIALSHQRRRDSPRCVRRNARSPGSAFPTARWRRRRSSLSRDSSSRARTR